MLQLSREADYALLLMLEVGAHTEGAITTAEVARRQQIPYEFLRRYVARTLVRQGLLVSERGTGGGLTLARPAEKISVLDIVRAFGSLALNRCTADPPRCDCRELCPVYPVWAEAQYEVERVLGGTRLSSLIGRQMRLDQRASRRRAAREATARGGKA
jgi:Rrf2 family protein